MTIAEAQKRCIELREQIAVIRDNYDFGGFARYIGQDKRKPLEDEVDKLVMAIDKAGKETDIKI